MRTSFVNRHSSIVNYKRSGMREDTVRTFIAVPLTDACKNVLEGMQQDLRKFSAEVRWVSISSIHLTLKFLGEVEPAMIDPLAEALEKATISERALALRLQGLGCFPNMKNPRVIWCGIEGEIDGLAALQQKVEAACRQFGFSPEDRPFRPHLTLGRVQGKRNLQPVLDCIKIGSARECSFDANCFNVYKSTLKPQGAVYSVLKTIRLGVGQ